MEESGQRIPEVHMECNQNSCEMAHRLTEWLHHYCWQCDIGASFLTSDLQAFPAEHITHTPNDSSKWGFLSPKQQEWVVQMLIKTL